MKSSKCRPAWEHRALDALVSMVRLEGADLSLDGGYTAENHTPAIRDASREWTEYRIIPLLDALISRDRRKAKAVLSHDYSPAFHDDIPGEPSSVPIFDVDPQVTVFSLMAEIVRVNRDTTLSDELKETRFKSVRAEMSAACEQMGTPEYRAQWLCRELSEATATGEREQKLLREWVKELRENPAAVEELTEELVGLEEEDVRELQRLRADDRGLIV